MSQSTIFFNNKSQAVRLPADSRFPDSVKKVNIRTIGVERIISPLEHTWDTFFMSQDAVTDDFLAQRDDIAQKRESFDD